MCDVEPDLDSPVSTPSTVPPGAYIARVDLTTNAVVATFRYEKPISYIQGVAVDGESLWWDLTFTSGCSSECKGVRHLERVDVATGKNTLDLPDVQLEGTALGFVWVRNLTGGMEATEGPLRKLDPKTGEDKGSIPFGMPGVQFACGSLWGLTRSNWATDEASTTVARIDPANGTVLAKFSLPGWLGGLESVGGECWAAVAPAGTDLYAADHPDHFVRIGDLGVEYTSPRFALNNVMGGASSTSVTVQGGAFWVVRSTTKGSATLQRLDTSWRPSGTLWQARSSSSHGNDAFAFIDGSVWLFDDEGGISRLDIPLRSAGG